MTENDPTPQPSPAPDDLPELESPSFLQDLLHHEAFAAVLLLTAAVSAMIVANSPAAGWYHDVFHEYLGIFLGDLRFEQSLHHWINDGLMAIFFFLVGLEIKRELLVGELASPRKAMLPIAAAFGGMLVPALIYTAFNYGTPAQSGWGIPMATDIAFAGGCIGLLSGRIPAAVSVFLIALAIVDDLGSVLVIAVFYTDRIAVQPLAVGVAMILFSLLISRLGVRRAWPYALIFACVWVQFLASGVHATIAGVLLAFTIPASARYESPLFAGRIQELLRRFQGAEVPLPGQVTPRQQSIIRGMKQECIHVEAPLQRIEMDLHPLSAFVIMPVFAFANSGLHLEWSELRDLAFDRVTLGVFLGLFLGKQIGIMLFSWLAVKSGLAALPDGTRWLQIYGVSCLAGIGFTMSLFVNGLAFRAVAEETQEAFMSGAKLGVFAASILAGLVGIAILVAASRGQSGMARGAVGKH